MFAKANGGYQLYDIHGNRKGSETFDDARLFLDDLAAVSQGGKWGFANTDGDIVIPCQFDGADSFHLGIAPIEQNEKWGFANLEGEVVVEPQYSKATVLSDVGVAGVGSGDSMRYIQFYKFSVGEE